MFTKALFSVANKNFAFAAFLPGAWWPISRFLSIQTPLTLFDDISLKGTLLLLN
jgi:hypothetical protein